MLSIPWDQRKDSYEFAVVGSGYGGAITAARIAAALGQPHKLCILERGQEWQPGGFPDNPVSVLREARSDLNPLGLYELLNYRDISVIKGSGLGGTSLINANVAIVPDEDVFGGVDWPRAMRHSEMLKYYDRARAVLAAAPVPDAEKLLKFQALQKRARELKLDAVALDVAVNFKFDGPNDHGVVQRKCVKCGDCVTGCNFAAKNTLYMNYLPMAAKNGADIFTQTKVEWIERLPGGGWRIHGQHFSDRVRRDGFTLEAKNVILAAGSINSTEILLRSELHGLKVSPALGTGFSGNGDFFGLAYNGALQTDVLGYGQQTPKPGDSSPPGPSIVGAIRYNAKAPLAQRITVEDFSFPSASIAGAKTVFAALRGDDTKIGDEAEQLQRVLRDLDPTRPHAPDGALNHTMLYLVMGQDDARGTMNFDAPWFEPDGRMTIEWDAVGQQIVFTRMNEELRRHAHALSANFIANPTWSFFRTGHLITAHPLGGCPMGDDHLHGATDQYGRVYSNDGSVHPGLMVADGALIPSALGVNPFLTISAVAERIAERKVKELKGEPYPQPPLAVSMAGIDPLDVIQWSEPSLERVFRRTETMPLEKFVNQGGAPVVDVANRRIRNDDFWKGFFPKRHILNTLSSAIFTGFKKTFHKVDGKFTGITNDTDGRITAHNSLEEVTIDRQTGSLEPGKYILLRYLDAQWAGFYDIFKMVNEDLLIGRVYLGEYPNGARLFTFAMTRKYGFEQMSVSDHDELYEAGKAPTKEALNGVWRMDMVSNNNHLGSAAFLAFDLKPDGRLESRYRLMGLMEGLVIPSFAQDHFQLNDFTPFHDEIRQVDKDFMVGRYITGILPDLSVVLNGADLGILHSRPGTREFGFYYTLTRVEGKALPTMPLLAPFLDVQLPDGVGLTFDEEMTGWFFEGATQPLPGRAAERTIAALLPAAGGTPAGGVACSFQVKITARDINEFVDGSAHEAGLKGTIRFAKLPGATGVIFTIDEQASRFQYLAVNTETGEAEMRYHIEFDAAPGDRYIFEGRKYMDRTGAGGVAAIRELLFNYTTLYCHVYRLQDDGQTEIGIACLKFKTFEDFAAIGNLAGFLGSFTVTGTDDPLLQLRARMRFIAFTAQFAQSEYDPLAPDIGRLSMDVRAEILRGAATPDYFSTQTGADLQTILRDSPPTLPLEGLLNTGAASLNLADGQVNRDLFWKGSFAKDSLVGFEERLRGLADPGNAGTFARGAFWKRFDAVKDGVATGLVVNYDLDALPGEPEVRAVEYPDDNRRYFKKGDKILLLTYRNDPYKAVYDTIKVIDANNAIGVMHLGEFPNGVEFATFVMSRYGYPLERMSFDDYAMIVGPEVAAPDKLQGKWSGNLILGQRPNTLLMSAPKLVAFEFSDGKYRLDDVDLSGEPNALRLLDADTVVGAWRAAELPGGLLERLRGYVAEDGMLRFVVRRG